MTGLYPPGSTFKTVTVSAALQAGQVTPDSVLPCPGTENIEGRQIPNDDNFDLGEVPLHTAFARSCNTTMGRLAVNLPPDGLTKAAAQLGLGIDYTAPGMTTVTGSVPVADTSALRVEEGIGQGKVTATPFGMALVAAALARGSVPAPAIVAGQPGTPDRAPDPLPATVADQVKSMMRETVTSGTATALQDIPDMLGKTGTAEYIDDQHAHGWFVGIDGDLALAVFVSDAGSSGPAVETPQGRFPARADRSDVVFPAVGFAIATRPRRGSVLRTPLGVVRVAAVAHPRDRVMRPIAVGAVRFSGTRSRRSGGDARSGRIPARRSADGGTALRPRRRCAWPAPWFGGRRLTRSAGSSGAGADVRRRVR